MAGSIEDPRTVNRYVYVGDDPINLVDPDGRKIPCGIQKTLGIAGIWFLASEVAEAGAAAAPVGLIVSGLAVGAGIFGTVKILQWKCR